MPMLALEGSVLVVDDEDAVAEFMRDLLESWGVQVTTASNAGEAREIFSRVTLDGWAFDAELVVIALVHGYRLAQVPVTWHHEADSKVRVGRAVASSLAGVMRIRWQRLMGRYGRNSRA